jgi:hypothetical protein
MRQIFTSQRLETVEGVARLLEESGIETYTSHARSYRGRRRGGFSYSAANHEPQPGVWVVRADELVRARELLRQAGLLESTRHNPLAYEPANDPPAAQKSPLRTAMRVRLALLAVVTVLATLTSLRMLGFA